MNQFTVIYCSSEEINHEFNNIFNNELNCNWISTKNPLYPIEIIIDCKLPFELNGLDVVSHQYMIAKRVDLYGTSSEKLNSMVDWDIIGYFTFNSNQRSQWVAREIKHISTEKKNLRFLRLIIEGVHECPPNRYNQCSFISFQINGQRPIKKKLNNLIDLIENLTNSKIEAVNNENYSMAADFKNQLDNIFENKLELETLFKEKIEYLENENYLKVDEIMTKIKNIIYFDRNKKLIIQNENIIEEKIIKEEIENNIENNYNDGGGFFLTEFGNDTVIAIAEEEIKPNNEIINKPFIEFDKPIKPMPIEKIEEFNEEIKIQPNEIEKNINKKKKINKKENIIKEIIENENVDIINEEFKLEAEILISFFGESNISPAYSSSWSLRSQGFEKICNLIKNLKTQEEKIKALNGLIPLMRRRFSDGLKAVYVSAVEQTIDLCNNINLQGNNLSNLIHQLLPIVLTKLGDSNQRINEVSHQFSIWTLERDKNALMEIIQYSIKLPQSPNQYHILLAKMSLLTFLIDKYGLNEKGKLKISDIMNLAVPSLDSRKEEVRKAAFKIVYLCLKFNSIIAEKYLKNVPRLIKDQLLVAKDNENLL